MRRLAPLSVLVLALTIACGSETGSSPSPSPVAATTPTPSHSPTPLSCGAAVITAAASEPKLDRPAMAYDEDSKQVILLGALGTNPDSDTWSWTPQTGWKKLAPAHSPPGRTEASMAYDPATKKVVLFGGQATVGQNPLSDTWSWNGSDWAIESPVASPPAVVITSMAYDPQSQSVIAVLDNDAAQAVETWAWVGTSWRHLTPAQAPKYPKQAAGIAYSTAMSETVMYGTVHFTIGPAATPDPSTWTFAGGTWTAHPASGPNPAARMRPGMSADKNGGAVLFGGGGPGFTVYGDTWTWLGQWTLKHPAKQPSKRTRSSMAYDAACGVVVLYGGELQTASSLTLYRDTWVWNNTTWSKVG